MSGGRSVELLVEEQARRWQLRPRAEAEASWRRVVTMAYLPGAPVEEVARGVSARLGLDLFDREIVQQIARSAHLSERVVVTLDERGRSWLGDWLDSLASPAHLSTYGYLQQLRKVVGALARHGTAVIVGHGAHAILGPERSFRVLVVAPLEDRVASRAAGSGLTLAEARERLLAEESERDGFLVKHFHTHLRDPEHFDLVVNTSSLGVSGAVGAIAAAAPPPVAESAAAG